MNTVVKQPVKNIDYRKLTPAGRLFLDHSRGIITRIDLRYMPGTRIYDDLLFPKVVMCSKIPMSERMRRYGLQSVTPESDSGKRGPDGSRIPTESYIAGMVRCYGDRHDRRTIDLHPYAGRVVRGRMSLEDAVNVAGETILHLMEGEFELVE